MSNFIDKLNAMPIADLLNLESHLSNISSEVGTVIDCRWMEVLEYRKVQPQLIAVVPV